MYAERSLARYWSFRSYKLYELINCGELQSLYIGTANYLLFPSDIGPKLVELKVPGNERDKAEDSKHLSNRDLAGRC